MICFDAVSHLSHFMSPQSGDLQLYPGISGGHKKRLAVPSQSIRRLMLIMQASPFMCAAPKIKLGAHQGSQWNATLMRTAHQCHVGPARRLD